MANTHLFLIALRPSCNSVTTPSQSQFLSLHEGKRTATLRAAVDYLSVLSCSQLSYLTQSPTPLHVHARTHKPLLISTPIPKLMSNSCPSIPMSMPTPMLVPKFMPNPVHALPKAYPSFLLNHTYTNTHAPRSHAYLLIRASSRRTKSSQERTYLRSSPIEGSQKRIRALRLLPS